jgi:hypothetical protein
MRAPREPDTGARGALFFVGVGGHAYGTARTPERVRIMLASYFEPGTPRSCGSQGPRINVINTTRLAGSLKAQSQRRASAARIAWLTLTRKGLAKLPPRKP